MRRRKIPGFFLQRYGLIKLLRLAERTVIGHGLFINIGEDAESDERDFLVRCKLEKIPRGEFDGLP